MLDYRALIILPLMLGDYLLTLVGEVLRRKRYQEHIKIEHYELNPLWQKTVPKVRWFNPIHLSLTALVTFIFMMGMPDFLWGLYLSIYGLILARHLTNILAFTYLNKRPEALQGQATFDHTYVLITSRNQVLHALVPLLLAAIFSQQWSGYLWGGVLGLLLLMLTNQAWLWKHKHGSRSNLKQ